MTRTITTALVAPITEPTAFTNLPEADYHANLPLGDIPSLSSSMAKTIITGEAGPARLHQIMLAGQDHKPAWDLGSAAHEKILCRGIDPQYLEAPDWRKKESQDWRDAVYAAGGIPLLAKDRDAVDAMAEEILRHSVAGELFTRGEGAPECSMFTIDEQTGRWQRGRIDFLADRKTIVDYKTTGQSCEIDDWIKHSYNFDYRQQAYQYLQQAIALDLVDADAVFLHIVQETKAPFLVGSYQMSEEELADGAARTRAALDLWDRCLTLDEWPGVPEVIRITNLPAYARPMTEED